MQTCKRKTGKYEARGNKPNGLKRTKHCVITTIQVALDGK
jgi:hypothetical protein